MVNRPRGVIAAVPSPLRPDLSIDVERLIDHCRWLLAEGGCDGINLLGTTGEATSFPVEQRISAMQTMARCGLPLQRFFVGTGAASLCDAIALTRAACDLGFAGALLLPPFYYKGLDGASLIAYVDTVIERVGSSALRLYLYHIPQNTGVPYALELVEALHQRHPEIVAGLKDSAGNIAFSRALAAQLPSLDVFPSSESSLVEAKRSGFAGCISATANITGPLAQIAWSSGDPNEAREAIAKAMAIRDVLSTYPLVASVKAALAEMTGERAWERVLLPLRALSGQERTTLIGRLQNTEFRRSLAAAD